MVARYHNVPLQGFVRRELLFARFAWTLLPRAPTQFPVATKETRMIWTRDDHGKLISLKKTAEQCSAMANKCAPRSTSPKKRKHNDGGQQSITTRRSETRRPCRSFDSGLGWGKEVGEEDHDEGNVSEDSHSTTDLEERFRGRKRLRAGDG